MFPDVADHGSFPWENDGKPYWSVFRHGALFWAHRDEPNIVMVHYGDLKADLAAGMRRIAAALGISVAGDEWPELVAAASFESMKKNADRNGAGYELQHVEGQFTVLQQGNHRASGKACCRRRAWRCWTR